ncbi:hypothetical protein DSM25558_0175 [Agrobacterium sp. DSM 25558]|uniref:hypothetical protein n=1 Tax=Agrobacterium sp. DSM 25558 TaxID=1907665 RepID=UPI0009726565|nr:hypothetical protein [Agrobacterium sp. DSM 25558]SCX00773.1 hypothetical protein DSM25558_0175 [Agrobacterium sp. DSM 25558]
MKSRWDKFLDFLAVWVQPILAFIVLVSGAIMSFDYKKMRADFPRWPGLFDVLESNRIFWTFLISAVFSLILGLYLARREKTLVKLKTEIQKQQDEKGEIGNNIIILFDGLLLNLSRKLDVPRGANFRISLYVHDPDKGRFIPCGRYSPDPTVSNPGRTSYPDNEGCIAEGWKREWHFDNSIPASGTARRNYNQKHYGISEDANAEIRMLSCLYAVRRLDNVLGTPVAVLVVEAMDSNQFQQDVIRGKLDDVADDFARMVHNLKSYIPNPASAAESGL